MADRPEWYYEDVYSPEDVVKLVQSGQVPPDASFQTDWEDGAPRIAWFGYPKDGDQPARHYNALEDR